MRPAGKGTGVGGGGAGGGEGQIRPGAGGPAPWVRLGSGLGRAEGGGTQTPPASLSSREEKAELLLDSQAEVQGLEAEIRRLRQEVRTDAPRRVP